MLFTHLIIVCVFIFNKIYFVRLQFGAGIAVGIPGYFKFYNTTQQYSLSTLTTTKRNSAVTSKRIKNATKTFVNNTSKVLATSLKTTLVATTIATTTVTITTVAKNTKFNCENKSIPSEMEVMDYFFKESACILSSECNTNYFNFNSYCCNKKCCNLVEFLLNDQYVITLLQE